MRNNIAIISTSKDKYFYVEYSNGDKEVTEEMNMSYKEIKKICEVLFKK